MPLGACQVSGNQSEWLILPAHTHTHTHTLTDLLTDSTPAALHCCLPGCFLSFHGSSVYFAVSQSVAP